MLETIYLLFSGTTFIFILISLILPIYKKQHPVLTFISAFMCFVLALTSVQITSVHCEQATNSSDCFEYNYEYYPLSYFWGGLGVIMFFFGLLTTFSYGVETMGNSTRP
jgi:hypothetical protein